MDGELCLSLSLLSVSGCLPVSQHQHPIETSEVRNMSRPYQALEGHLWPRQGNVDPLAAVVEDAFL